MATIHAGTPAIDDFLLDESLASSVATWSSCTTASFLRRLEAFSMSRATSAVRGNPSHSGELDWGSDSAHLTNASLDVPSGATTSGSALSPTPGTRAKLRSKL